MKKKTIKLDIVMIKDHDYIIRMDPYTSPPKYNDPRANALALFSAIKNHKGSF